MRRRWIILSLAFFQILWLNIIVPGHLRGIVQLQTTQDEPACPMCCSTKPHKTGEPFTPAQQKNCAICFFAAHVSLPLVIAFDHAPLGLLQRLRPEQREDLFDRIVLVPFDSCGPPVIA